MEWIKCSDRMPERGKDVLGFKSNGGGALIVCLNPNGQACWNTEEEWWPMDLITHWMPLPEAPKP